jgi:hypothetical protein
MKLEVIRIARHQSAHTIFDVGDGAEAVVFQSKDVVGIVEWLLDTLEAHWLDAGEHGLF